MDELDLLTGAIPEEEKRSIPVANGGYEMWVVKHQPLTVDKMVLPASIRNKVETALQLNAFGHYVFYSTASGTGKTTLSKAIPRTLGTSFKFFSAREQSDIFTDIESYAALACPNGLPRFVVLDEADHPNRPEEFYRKLQGLIEDTQSTIRFILTCNAFHRLPDAIASRCFAVSFDYPKDDRDVKNAMYLKMMEIAQEETAPYNGTVDKNTVAEIVDKCYPDMRLMTSTMFNNFLENRCSIKGQITVVTTEYTNTLVDFVLAGDDMGARKFVLDNYVDFDSLFHKFADIIIEKNILPPMARLEFCVITGQYEQMSEFQVNPYTVVNAYISKVILLLYKYGLLKMVQPTAG